MTDGPSSKEPPYRVEIQYENGDQLPIRVDGMQGTWTPNGTFQLHFYSESIKVVDRLTPHVLLQGPPQQRGPELASRTVSYRDEPAFAATKDQVTIIRTITASVMLTEEDMRAFIQLMQRQLKGTQEPETNDAG